MKIEPFFDKTTFTLTYVVYDAKTRDAVVIDPVLDYNPIGSKIEDTSYKWLTQFIKEQNLNLHFVLETHAHADHLTSAQLFKSEFPKVKIAIGERIKKVQETFKKIFNLGDSFAANGSQFDLLLKENEVIKAGSLKVKTLFTPGHTPACVSYLIEDAVFTGDALFMPDYGTGRCDFPAGDSGDLYQSVAHVLYSLPENTRVFVGHDYLPKGRQLAYESTVGEEKQSNIQLNAETTKEEFIAFRNQRDSTLSAPKLLYPSIQVNIAAGQLPAPEENNTSYLKVPINKEY